jgi:chitinase
MNTRLLLISFFFLLISCSNDNDDLNDNIDNDGNNINLFSNKARVVGYFPYYRFSVNDQIEYCKITHLNISFGNPLADGTIVLPSSGNTTLADVVNRARSQNSNLKIYISLAGGALSSSTSDIWKNFLANSQDRPILIEKIVQYTKDNNLDGVDVDLEWSHVTEGYSDFVIELKEKLAANSLGMTAAFPSETKYSLITSEALNAFDFINIMAYDYTGPWNASSPGQHSSLNHAQRGVNYWKNMIGVNGEKLTLGVPFYGYNFESSTTVNSFTYGSMVASSVSNADRDNVGNKYYNGRPTIRDKVKLAAETMSGIMIWELGQDSFSEYSLLETIHKKYTDYGVETTNLCGN